MAKFKRKSEVVDAIRWAGKFGDGVGDFSFLLMPESQNQKCPKCGHLLKEHGQIQPRGDILCPGDWIITDNQGKKHACESKDFEQRYELVE